MPGIQLGERLRHAGALRFGILIAGRSVAWGKLCVCTHVFRDLEAGDRQDSTLVPFALCLHCHRPSGPLLGSSSSSAAPPPVRKFKRLLEDPAGKERWATSLQRRWSEPARRRVCRFWGRRQVCVTSSVGRPTPLVVWPFIGSSALSSFQTMVIKS